MTIKAVDPSKLTEEEAKARFALIDSITESPDKRATKIHSYINALKFPEWVSQWDMMCFCTYYLCYTTGKDDSMLYEALRKVLFSINQFHYFYCETHEEEAKERLAKFAETVKHELDEKVWTIDDLKK